MDSKRMSTRKRVKKLEDELIIVENIVTNYNEIIKLKEEIENNLKEIKQNIDLFTQTQEDHENELFLKIDKLLTENEQKTTKVYDEIKSESLKLQQDQLETLNNFLIKVEEKIKINNKYIDELLESKELNFRNKEEELLNKISNEFTNNQNNVRELIEKMKIDFNEDISTANLKFIEDISKTENSIILKLTELVNTEVNNANAKNIQQQALDYLLEAFNKVFVDYNEEEKTSINEAIKHIISPKLLTPVFDEEDIIKTSKFKHESYDKLKTIIDANLVPMLVGPAGTGKSEAVGQIAKELKLRLYMGNRVQNSFEITGFVDAGGKYIPTQFHEAYTKGGLFFFDEVDASSPEALVTINTAIAQRYMTFPGYNTPIVMHDDFKLVTAANTSGSGATLQYTGRNKLDAATLDRFTVIEWNYDQNLERDIISDHELLEICWELREKTERYKDIIISTRGIKSLEQSLIENKKTKAFSKGELFRLRFFKTIRTDIIQKIVDSLSEELINNKYYKILKEI